MSFYTLPEIRQAMRRSLPEGSQSDHSWLKEWQSGNRSDNYDVYLMSNEGDESLLAGAKRILEERSAKVFTDYYYLEGAATESIEFVQMQFQQDKMDRCRSLLFVCRNRPIISKRVAWMLGYFYGKKPGNVAILPLIDSCLETPRTCFLLWQFPVIVHTDHLASKEQRPPRQNVISLDGFLQAGISYCGV